MRHFPVPATPLPPAFIQYVYLAVNSASEQCSDALAERQVQWILDAQDASRALDGRLQPSLNPEVERKSSSFTSHLRFFSALNFPYLVCSQYYICCVARYVRSGFGCHCVTALGNIWLKTVTAV